MKKITTLLLVLIFELTSHYANAQTANIDTLLVGKWKGTSICQMKNTRCKDEIAVYYISKGKEPGTFNIDGRKVVDGVEQEMGILICTYDKKTSQLTSTNQGGTWTFTVKDGKIDGKLVSESTVYRVVNLAKQ